MRTVDLFAGCGGLSLGFANVGFDIVAAFEFWAVAADCYEKNFSHPVFRQDLSYVKKAVEIIKSFNPDMIIGGPPCQDFSHAGKRIEAGRAVLTEAFAEIIEQIRPRYFVMENVDRAEKSSAFTQANTIFKNAGYGLTKVTLDASRCGVPQKRKRFFCVGALGKPDNFIEPFISARVSGKETTLRDYFGETLDFEHYYRHPRNYNRRAVFSIDEPAPTMRGVNRPVPKGYPGHANDACPLNDNIRALTTLERALIQTFPADFKWCGNKTEMEQMIGNAVPVKLAEFVGAAIFDAVNDSYKLEPIQDDFKAWLIMQHKYSERTANDTVSRIKRANKLCSFSGESDALYMFKLQKTDAFSELTPSVRSQLKRAVTLYFDYMALKSDHILSNYAALQP